MCSPSYWWEARYVYSRGGPWGCPGSPLHGGTTLASSRLSAIIRCFSCIGGQMYTLEDDQETSSRLRKRDFQNTSYIPAAPRDGSTPATPEEKIPGSMPAASEKEGRFAVPKEKDPEAPTGRMPPASHRLKVEVCALRRLRAFFLRNRSPVRSSSLERQERTLLAAAISAQLYLL